MEVDPSNAVAEVKQEGPAAPEGEASEVNQASEPSDVAALLQGDPDPTFDEEEPGAGEVEDQDDEPVVPTTLVEKQAKKTEVCVGGLEPGACEEDVKAVFSAAGEVLEVSLNLATDLGPDYAGYGYVRYATAEEAKKAIDDLDGVEVCGHPVAVVLAEDNMTLFLGSINKEWTKDDVVDKLCKCGTVGVTDVMVMEDPQKEGFSRGFCFVEFVNSRAAVAGLSKLSRPKFSLDGCSIKVAWASPLTDPDDEIMSQVKSVFVEGVPVAWEVDNLKELFGSFGEIERVVMAKSLHGTKRKDFAFVNYTEREAALKSIEARHDADITDAEGNTVKLKVSLAKPRAKPADKGKGAKGGKGQQQENPWGVMKGGKGAFNNAWGMGVKGGKTAKGFASLDVVKGGKEPSGKKEGGRGNQKEGDGADGEETDNSKAAGAIEPSKKEEPMGYLDATTHAKVKRVLQLVGSDKTPLMLLHEYTARNSLEVAYSTNSDTPMGPFEVTATINKNGTATVAGTGTYRSKQEAKQLAAANCLETLLKTVPESDFTRSSRQRQAEKAAAAAGSGKGGKGGKGDGEGFGKGKGKGKGKGDKGGGKGSFGGYMNAGKGGFGGVGGGKGGYGGAGGKGGYMDGDAQMMGYGAGQYGGMAADGSYAGYMSGMYAGYGDVYSNVGAKRRYDAVDDGSGYNNGYNQGGAQRQRISAGYGQDQTMYHPQMGASQASMGGSSGAMDSLNGGMQAYGRGGGAAGKGGAGGGGRGGGYTAMAAGGAGGYTGMSDQMGGMYGQVDASAQQYGSMDQSYGMAANAMQGAAMGSASSGSMYGMQASDPTNMGQGSYAGYGAAQSGGAAGGYAQGTYQANATQYGAGMQAGGMQGYTSTGGQSQGYSSGGYY